LSFLSSCCRRRILSWSWLTSSIWRKSNKTKKYEIHWERKKTNKIKDSNWLEISSFFNFERIVFHWSKEIGTWSFNSKYPSLLVQVIWFLFILNLMFSFVNTKIVVFKHFFVCRNDRFVIEEKISCSTSFFFCQNVCC